jgi:hypothetical protein
LIARHPGKMVLELFGLAAGHPGKGLGDLFIWA